MLPSVGPAWYPIVMGTGILATLLGYHQDRSVLVLPAAAVLLALAWIVLGGLTVGFGLRCRRSPGTLRATLADPVEGPGWGTVAMGILSAGSAAGTVLPRLADSTEQAAYAVFWATWALGTLLSLATTLDFATRFALRGMGTPTPVWGLPVVAPMVPATLSCVLAQRVDAPGGRLVMILVGCACFAVSFVLAGLVFATSYHHHWRREPLPLHLRTSLWIPLGIVGQSTAAAQLIASDSLPLLRTEVHDTVLALARGYGLVVLALLGPLVAGYAAVTTVRAMLDGLPFTPGWWSMTFPVGTCALGAHLSGVVHGSDVWATAGWVITLVLVGTWSLCAVATVRALLQRRAA